jgi:hypothetical protein
MTERDAIIFLACVGLGLCALVFYLLNLLEKKNER